MIYSKEGAWAHGWAQGCVWWRVITFWWATSVPGHRPILQSVKQSPKRLRCPRLSMLQKNEAGIQVKALSFERFQMKKLSPSEVVAPELFSCAFQNLPTGLYLIITSYGRVSLHTWWPAGPLTDAANQSRTPRMLFESTRMQHSFLHHVAINTQLLKGVPPCLHWAIFMTSSEHERTATRAIYRLNLRAYDDINV